MVEEPYVYLMEHEEEKDRLEMKTDPLVLRKQAEWCGIKPGQRLLDFGCGPGLGSGFYSRGSGRI